MGILSNGVPYYDFDKRARHQGHYPNLIEIFIYSFRSTKTHHIYIAEVEHYNHDLYAIKFYLKAHRNSLKKYNLLTGLNEGRPVIYTCIAIMLEIFKKDSNASFAFIGSPSQKEIDREEDNPRLKKDSNTQRYRIYSMFMSTFFSEKCFSHHHSNKCSLYLMLNKNSGYKLKEMQDMINVIYNIDMEDLE